MRAVVVYESMFGNTREVAEAIGEGLSARLGADSVELIEVGQAATAAEGADLLVVGGPTHAFGLSRRSTRQSAAEMVKGVPPITGLREWLAAVAPVSRPVPAAAYCTRVKEGLMPGSAAKGVATRLRRRGYRLIAAPCDFWVGGTRGPLRPGEYERAQRWGEDLAVRVAGERSGTAS
jgi:hypothetical protein